MDEDILQCFSDSTEIQRSDAIIYEMASNGVSMGVNRAQTDTATGRISTLSEVFLEWYLFDSSEKKDVKTFLSIEEIQDVFTESDFMDLMCGLAYLDDDLLPFVLLKLPFSVFPDKLRSMNAKVAASKKARKINSPVNLVDKIKDRVRQNDRARKDKKNIRKREIYAERIDENHVKQREYREKNRDRINARKRADWAKHADEINQKRREKYKENREELLAKAKQWRDDHKEWARQYEKMRRERDHESRVACQKRCVEKNKEHYKKYKHTWYEAHKAQSLQEGRDRYQKNKEKAESAQKICAAYVFLMNLRKTNREKYLELYTPQQKPLLSMLKTCAALQSMDMTLCPFCNPESNQKIEECCNQKVLSISGAINELQIIATNLKQR